VKPFLRRWPGLLSIAVATLCFQLPFFDRWFSPMDEGHVLLFADLVGDGATLYRDATIYPLPGAFYALALAFQVFEPSILLARWIVVLEFAAFVALATSLLQRIVTPTWALAFVALLWLYRIWAFPHWHMYGYSTTALLVLLASAIALLRYFESRERGWLLLSGFVYGLGVFCKQDYGAAFLLALGFALVVDARSGPIASRRSALASLALFVAPAALVGAAAGLHFFLQGQLGFVIQLTALNHFVGMATYEYPSFPPFLPLFRQIPELRESSSIVGLMPGILTTADFRAVWSSPLMTQTALFETWLKLFIYGPYALLATGAVRLWRRRAALDAPDARLAQLTELLLFGIATGLVLVINFVKPQDYVHLAVLYWPLIALGTVYAADLAATRRRLALALAGLALLPTLAFVGYSARLVWRLRTIHSAPIASERAGIYVLPEEAQLLDDVVDYVRRKSSPDEPVAAMPYFSVAQFLAERRGPHAASYIVWPFPEYPDRDERVIDAMEATKTPLVLYNFTQFLAFPPVSEYAPALYDYLVDHYAVDRVFSYDYNGYKLAALVRSDGADAGRPLLDPDLVGASLWIEDESGARERVGDARREDFLVRERWPFRPVLALVPSTKGSRTVLEAKLEVPAAALLRTAVGVHPGKWFDYPPSWVEFQIAVRDGDVREVIFRRRLDPHKNFSERRWFDVDLPLDAWAGRSVTLELSTEVERERARDLRMGGFAEPRVVATDGSDRAAHSQD